jgi:protein disulfide-isomerase-like protein
MAKSDTPSEYSDSDVIEADAATLDALAADAEGAGALVTFYAPWCGHCVKMVPEFKKAATALKPRGIRLAAVNTDAERGLAQRLGIKGFPTVRFVHAGKWSADFQGPRQATEFVTFAGQQAVAAKLRSTVASAVGGAKRLGKLAMCARAPRARALVAHPTLKRTESCCARVDGSCVHRSKVLGRQQQQQQQQQQQAAGADTPAQGGGSSVGLTPAAAPAAAEPGTTTAAVAA